MKRRNENEREASVIGIIALAALVLLSSCSGGGSSGGGATTTTASSPVITTGTMTTGSVIVNGVRFTADSGATIRVDDNPGRPETELRDGMQVKVKGQINDDRITGRFEKVEAEPEVRGKLASLGTGSFAVNGQIVYVDDSTVFEDRIAGVFSAITFTALGNANEVEVHGGRDDQGRVRATRVERRDDSPLDEVKGTISTVPNGATFTLTNGTISITVSYGTATITPAGATLSQGDFVQVHGSFSAGTFTASLINREDLEDAEFEPTEGQEFEVEGHINGFTAHPGEFQVEGRTVRTTLSTRFEGGSSADLDNNVKVEAEGHLSIGALVADKIKFKSAQVRIEALATAIDTTARTVTVMGRTVQANDLTRFDDALNTITANTDRVEVRAYVDKAGTIIAIRLKKVGGGSDALQAPVSAKNATAKTLTLLDGGNAIAVSLSGTPEDHFLNYVHAPIGSVAFFGAVTPASGTTAGTLVKVKGTFSAGSITGTEAELEN
ncbi:MAG: hypothetical protein HGA43_07820 [Nitrospirae bacterium]|nr:hypothetical protein [Nitrospirota bacterium]